MASAPSSAPSFSAFYAHKRAVRSACRLCPTSSTVECGSCKGTGTMSLRIETISVENREMSTSTIKCVFCTGGTVDARNQLYNRLIMCQCKQQATSGFLYARDGRRVFGNETYLCRACGFVKQFG
jgi:hypothetical protein